MQLRATAFLMRSIRQDSRLVSHHGMRAGLAAMVLYLFFMQFYFMANRSGAGAAFAGSVVKCCYWFLTIVGGVHFSGAIVEEKEEGTFALLRMTGASSFSILAGKSLPRLAVAILFLFVIAPFLMLSITLGGVLPYGLISSILSILCYAVMLSQLGLLASVVSRTTKQAFALSSLLWGLFELGHWWAALASGLGQAIYGGSSMAIAWRDMFGELSVWLSQRSLVNNLSAGLLAFSPSDLWHANMTFHLFIAIIFFALSWWLFEPCTARALTGADRDSPRAAMLKKRVSVSRVWPNAVMWKSWYYVSGGRTWMLMRILVAPLVIFGCAATFACAVEWGVELQVAFGISIFASGCFFLINSARLFGGLVSNEIHEKTLASLVMLPQKTSSTLGSMLIGIVPAALAGGFGFALFTFLTMLTSGASADNLARFLAEPWCWHFVSWIAVTLHFGLLLTTYVRHGGMLLAVAVLWVALPMFLGISMSLIVFGFGAVEIIRYLMPLFLIGLEVALCVSAFWATVRRLDKLASN